MTPLSEKQVRDYIATVEAAVAVGHQHAPLCERGAMCAKDLLSARRALKRIVKLGESRGFDTKELDMVAIAKRAIGRTT